MSTIRTPWAFRLSENFMLSDFMYSDSIIRRGMANHYESSLKVNAHRDALVELLDEIYAEYGHMSITYGYIDPEVSMRTVKWKNPADPSYHRWDDGAAADIIVHDWIASQRTGAGKWLPLDEAEASPMMLAREISSTHDFSRMIVYSESPGICVAVRHSEKHSGNPRRAFYENRWQGDNGIKPRYITHSQTPKREAVREGLKKHGWVGGGHPSYHGKGKLQYHHIRIGRYLTLLDCLRCPYKLDIGEQNRPPNSKASVSRFMKVGHAMSRFIEWYYHFVGTDALSIIAGHNSRSPDDLFQHLYPENVARDWGQGEGTMVFSMTASAGREFHSAWSEHGMLDYGLHTNDNENGHYLGVTWRS